MYTSAEQAERDRIGFVITNTGTEALTKLTFADVTAQGYAGKVVDIRVLQVAGDKPAAGITASNLAQSVLEPGQTVVLDGALVGLSATTGHKDTVTVTAVGVDGGESVDDADDWFAKVAQVSVLLTPKITGGVKPSSWKPWVSV